MTSKNLSLQYFNIEAAEEDYFSKLYENMLTIISAGNTCGSFEAGMDKYAWEVLERVDIDDSASFLMSLAKEKTIWPTWMTEDGALAELSLSGTLGDQYYCLINPAYEFVITYGNASAFKKLLGQFSVEGVVRLDPYFEAGIYEKVMAWDCYTKLCFSMSFPNGSDMSDYGNTKAGELTKVINYLGGLKADIEVSAGGGKELLSNMMVKDLLPELLANDLCKSLIVRGSDFENAKAEEYDLKNAQIKYKETLEIEGNYITAADIKQVFMRAVNERHSMLFNGVQS